MNSTKLWMTAQTPSRFGMPICGHASVASARATDLVVWERTATANVGAVKRYMDQSFPGTSAWRPPTC